MSSTDGGDRAGGAYRGYRDTTQVDMPMAPPRPSAPVSGARVVAPRPHARPSDHAMASGPVGRGGAIGMSTCAVSRYPRNPPPVLS